LKDRQGVDIEPVAELPEAKEEEATEADPWGSTMAAAIATNLISLVGVVFLVPVCMKASANHVTEFQSLSSGFAAGAILACAFFLLLYESTHLIAVEWKNEVDVLWRWGTMIMAGFLLPALTHIVVTAVMGGQKKSDSEAALRPASTRARLISGILIGDFFHNLCDGFFLAAAFKGCGESFGWTVLLGTIIHEIPQEIADYTLLTGPEVAWKPVKALLSNFVSGLGVVFGAVIILASEIGDGSTGLLLAFGGGVYLHVAATECMPRIYKGGLSPKVQVGSQMAFFVGAIVIGLVLIKHEHCVPEAADGDSDPHAGHHH